MVSYEIKIAEQRSYLQHINLTYGRSLSKFKLPGVIGIDGN